MLSECKQMFNRVLLLESQADFVVFSIRGSMGSWVTSRISRCREQIKKTAEKLQGLGIPPETLRTQWDAQKASLASVETR